MKYKKAVIGAAVVLAVVWAAFIWDGAVKYQAACAGAKGNEYLTGRDAERYAAKLRVMDAEEAFAGVIVPVIGGPIYRASHADERKTWRTLLEHQRVIADAQRDSAQLRQETENIRARTEGR